MDERVTSGKVLERPMTRWHREQDNEEGTQRPLTGVTAQNRFDRPKSRRGTKEETNMFVTSASNRSATPGRSALARPPSASILYNRVPTAGPRLATSNMARLNTGLSMGGQMNMNVVDRPITQHGLAGVRPGTTRGLSITRQIQDKRYYVGILQIKIRELTQEIGAIMKDIENQNKERATFLHYDKRAKDLASELTSLQGELADYNIVVDKMTSDISKESIMREAEELALKNERTLLDIERMFDQRRELEQQISKLEKQLENEKKRTERIIESMDLNTKEKYDDLLKEKSELQEQTNKIQQELDELSKQYAYLEEEISLSPLKQEAVKLHLKITEAEEKRDKLREEGRNRLSPEEEKEKLLQKIKQDNMDIAAAEAQLTEKKKKIKEVEQKLEQLETDIEDTHSEKQIKYTELRKREETMEQFMLTFDQNKEDETKKLDKLEKTIVQRLESISGILDNDIDLSVNEEMAILRGISPYKESANQDRSFEGLMKEHLKLQEVYGKMEVLEHNIRSEANDIREKIGERENNVQMLTDLDTLRAKSETKLAELKEQREQLEKEEFSYEEKLKPVRDEYNEIAERLKNNEVYCQISTLESKLEKLQEDHKKIEDYIREKKEQANYGPLKERVFNLTNEYSGILKESLKAAY